MFRNWRSLVRSLARQIFFLRIDDSHSNRIYFSYHLCPLFRQWLCVERILCVNQFIAMFPTLSKTGIETEAKSNLSSVNVLNLVQSKMLVFGVLKREYSRPLRVIIYIYKEIRYRCTSWIAYRYVWGLSLQNLLPRLSRLIQNLTNQLEVRRKIN